MSGDYQPRYVAYATAHGRSPADQAAHDAKRWPTAPMCGFMAWVTVRLGQWKADHGINQHVGLTAEQDRAFDTWATQQPPLDRCAERTLHKGVYASPDDGSER